MVNGIELDMDGELVRKSVSIRLFILDSVGRADLCKIMAHSSYQGCPMCKFTEKTADSQKKKRNQKKSSNEISFKKFRPADFAREIQSFEYLHKFKATELRQFLLYGSIVFLKGLVADHIYNHWLLLHIAVRLLSSPSLTSENIDNAETLLKEFVKRFPSIYGSNSVTYKVHVLIHIPYFSRLYGPLDEFSMYRFENYIQKLKKYIRKAELPLQQIYKRIEEEEAHTSESFITPHFNQTEIKDNEKDGFVALRIDNYIVPFKVMAIYEHDSKSFFAVRRCLKLNNVYTSDNCMNSSDIGEITFESLDCTIEHFETSTLMYKYCRIPFKNVFVLIPILHTVFKKFNN